MKHSFLLLSLLFSFSLHASSQSLDTVAVQFPNMGYAVKTPVETDTVSTWEKKTFGTLVKRCVKIKSVAAVSWDKHTFSRFEIWEEQYADSGAAKNRIANLLLEPPGFVGEEDKVFPLRRGFYCGMNVWIVTTDVAAFDDELAKLNLRLEEIVCNKPAACCPSLRKRSPKDGGGTRR